MTTLVNKHASRLAHQRWDALSPEERSAAVPKNGGRPRIYQQCPVRKHHRFVKDNTCCWCGFVRPTELTRLWQSDTRLADDSADKRRT